MRPVHACTIIARNYLPFARLLAESFSEYHPAGHFTVLLIDDTDRVVDSSVEPFEILHLDEIMDDRAELHRLAMIYDVTELATAVKPLLLRRLLEHKSHIVYLDPDIQVFAPLDDVAGLAEQHSIVLTPHTTAPMSRDGRKPSEADILGSGVYNLGFLALGPGCGEFLAWWEERLRRDCIVDHQRMLFTDQKWIDFVPGYFRHHILHDPTLNVAYWNVDQRGLVWTGERYEVNGLPLRFFHFSGFKPELGYLLSQHQGHLPRVLLSERPDLARICAAYAEALANTGYRSDAANDTYAWDVLPSGMKVDRRIHRLYRAAVEAAEAGTGPEPPDPFDAAASDAFLEWLNEPVNRGPRPTVSRYLLLLWQDRPDLRTAFPNLAGPDSARYLAWVLRDGVAQEAIPDLLLPLPGQADDVAAGWRTTGLLPGVNVAGYFKAELGVGEGGRLLVDIVEEAGMPVATFAYGDTASRQEHPFADRGPRDAPYDVNVLCVNADRTRAFAEDVGSDFFAGRHTIGMWAWEIEDFPPEMHDGFQFVDEIWAVSTFAADAIRRVSPKPVYALPHPIVASTPPPFTREDLGLPLDRFVFLFVFDMFSLVERKNPFGLLEAFTRAFEPGEGPLLVIKTINGHRQLVDQERLRAAAAERPDVLLIDRYLSAGEKAALMAVSDCYVSLHRAEGFGLTLAEAMALGKPVIATGYSGNLDFMDESNSFLCDYRLTPIPRGCAPYPEGSLWAEPDVSHAARLMRAVVGQPGLAAARGAKGAADIRRLHSTATRVPFVTDRLAAIRERRAEAAASGVAAQPTALDEVAGRLSIPPGGEPTASRLGRPRKLARRAALRTMRPYWWGQRALDGAMLQALRETQEQQAELASQIEQLTSQLRNLDASAANVHRDLRRVAARSDEANAETIERLETVEGDLHGVVTGKPRLFGGGIDSLRDGLTVRRGAVEVAGWVLAAPAPVSRVEVTVGDKVVGRARLGLPRPDVETEHPVPDAALSGFSMFVDLSTLPSEATETTIAATVVTTVGNRLPLATVRVRLASRETVDPETAAVAADMRARTRQLSARQPSSPRPEGLRMLAFSHDLGRGGAQSFLADIVARLATRPGFSCTVVSPSEGPMRAPIEEAGARVHVTPGLPVDGAESYEGKIQELSAWVGMGNFDVVLANTLVAFHGIDVANRLGLPSVWAIHESYALPEFWAEWDRSTTIHPYVQERAIAAFGQASLVTFVADATRRMYLRFAAPEGGAGDSRRFVVVPNAVDVGLIGRYRRDFRRESARAAHGIRPDDRLIVCVGAIIPRKGQAVLARALTLLAEEHPKARVVMVGDLGGAYSAALHGYVASAGLGERLVTLPYSGDVLEWYGMADVVACPSDNESLPTVVLEAMAMGVPVVASRIFGIPDVITDGATGYLCEPSDVASLADALRRALDAPDTARAEIAAAGARVVEDHHSAEARGERMWELLTSLSL